MFITSLTKSSFNPTLPFEFFVCTVDSFNEVGALSLRSSFEFEMFDEVILTLSFLSNDESEQMTKFNDCYR